ncbi:MAG: LemA family protein, partial [Deltaproteobacteria bacterium]|nr:LemA family protein [Deltaproteobacteria bacterium]
MKKGLIFIGVLALIFFWGISARNNLVTLDEGVKEKWSQVENVYQRRLDLIPNLVNTVKGYAAHEKETLEGVVQARAQASQISGDALKNVINDPQAFQKFQESQGALSSALSKLMVVVERYPDLKANQGFLDLQSQLEGTENRITVERKRFNEAAKEYNIIARKFPQTLIASLFGFKEKSY